MRSEVLKPIPLLDESGNLTEPGGKGLDYMKPWRFTSGDGRFEMDFIPVPDSGGTLEIKDFFGFARRAENRWCADANLKVAYTFLTYFVFLLFWYGFFKIYTYLRGYKQCQ